jgi:hypothetical protein
MPASPLQINATNKKWANRPSCCNTAGESVTKIALESKGGNVRQNAKRVKQALENKCFYCAKRRSSSFPRQYRAKRKACDRPVPVYNYM